MTCVLSTYGSFIPSKTAFSPPNPDFGPLPLSHFLHKGSWSWSPVWGNYGATMGRGEGSLAERSGTVYKNIVQAK